LDFDAYVYVAAIHGSKPTTQYYFVVEQVVLDRELVTLALQLKDDGEPAEEETWPYIVLAIAKTAQIQGDVVVAVQVNGEELCRVERSIAPPTGD
jgi:hypothetical protein